MPNKRARRGVTIRDTDTLKDYLLHLHEGGKSWNQIAAEYPGMKRGTLQRFATSDYEPKDAHIRAVLGLPVFQPVPICPIHGVVHIAKQCPSTRKKNTIKKRNWKKAALESWALLYGERR